jgi:hypothetical protein
LDVQRVTVCGKPATFSMSVPDPDRPHLGSRLEIDLRGSGVGVVDGVVNNSDRDDSDGRVISVSIQYATSPNASAAQWLPPSQTAGKEHPYVFSACFVSMLYSPPAPRPPERRRIFLTFIVPVLFVVVVVGGLFHILPKRNARPYTREAYSRARTAPPSR